MVDPRTSSFLLGRPRRLLRDRVLPAVRTSTARRTTTQRAAEFYRTRSIAVLRISVGVVYCWFGVLKLFPAGSPAEEIAAAAMSKLTGGLLPPHMSVPLLGTTEALIGLALVTGLLLRPALILFFAHMAGVFASLALLPGQMWHHGAPSLEGQYVLKNLVLVAACLAVTSDELTR
ncbi:DoxX family membrane protein [Streptomyces sp. I4(2020)]|uniref:DoxX family membrane protein n=1 Tax=Streptomyces sp. I4(2020) TaxID=2760981 RepID=UPI0018EEA4A1|nr:DoxX family membrane protein [Streptomyces sp. I4(2020)]MBJ6613862.1 DoxX family membrane protein [Streptomyces sp. I3(2020)]MBJ6628782.1 DoxX family membrane protein [Streptomyces sp. I4(2020)]